MDKKPYEKILNYISEYYEGQCISIIQYNMNDIFNNTIFNEEFLDFDDFISYYANNIEYDPELSLYQQYKDVDEINRMKIIEVLSNMIAYSNTPWNIKQKVASFLIRYNLMLEDGDGYRKLINSKIFKDLEGSFATIFFLNDTIVKKQLKLGYWSDSDICSRFKNEYILQKKLYDLNLNVLGVYDYDELNHTYLMDRADCDLDDYLSDNILSNEDKINISKSLINDMKIAHDNSVIHRDLHLGNILIKDNEIFISDFGFAKDEKFQRSKLSTVTPKPTHVFVAPEGLKDFTKLDKISDIYSIGKIIDYIFGDRNFGQNHPYKILVEKCCRSNKEDRYQDLAEVLIHFNEISQYINNVVNISELNSMIENNQYSVMCEEYIVDLAEKGSLSQQILINNWIGIGNLIEKFNYDNAKNVLQSISDTFIEATGYRGWENYDVFAKVAYEVTISEMDISIIRIAYSILEECSKYRIKAKQLFDAVPEKIRIRI